jgi:hypoxanthine-DNA glycosylase
LKLKRVGLWDVINSAHRIGSLDSKIRGEISNDFEALLTDYPNIRGLVFNGRKAQKVFTRLVMRKQDLPENLFLDCLPSTSSAYIGKSFEIKLAEWKRLREFTNLP